MAKTFKDDNYRVIELDIDKIRQRPSMYISYTGSDGVMHLCKELINNNIDECLKPESPGNTVMIDIGKKAVSSKDNGRGIPYDLLQVVHETNQAGSNFTRESGAATAGENGTGTTCLAALSKDFTVTTYRPNEKKKLTLHYHEGKLLDRIEVDPYSGDEHGLESTFVPSKQILGCSEIPTEDLIKWISDFRYTLPENIHLSYKYNGELVHIKHKPIYECLTDPIGDNRLCEPVIFECEGDLDEEYREQITQRHFKLKAAVMYSSKEYKGEPIRESWMNMIHTIRHGAHVNGVLNGMAKYLTEKCVKKKSSLKDENLRRDIEANLNLVVIAETNMINVFTSQTKHEVFPTVLSRAVAAAVYKAFENMNQNRVMDLVDVVIDNNRVRKEGERVRDINSSTKKTKWEKPDSFIPCSTAKSDYPKELFLVEGKSAGGGLREARYPLFQAILEFKGKSLNVWDQTLSRVLKSLPWLNLVKVMECGIGDSFDINKLKWDKIIITTDADIDGYHIRTQMCSFFLKFYPEIIQAGRLYIAEPPLYQLVRGKDVYYVASQGEYIAKCIESVGKMKTHFPMSVGYENDTAANFITNSFDYLTRLTECSITRSVNRNLLEYIANAFVQYGCTVYDFKQNVDKWLRSVSKVFKEIGFDQDKNQLYATIDLQDQLVIIDEELINALEYVIQVQRKYGLLIEYESASRSGSTTLGRFFEIVEAIYPVIKDRYKGLGSSPGIVSRQVIMDPKTRRIFRVTAQDVDVMKRMSNLVGDGIEDKRNRKEMLMNFHITSDMLDN